MKTISVVIPVYQNEESIVHTCDEISRVLRAHSDEVLYDIVLVNDGSSDHSWDVLLNLQQERRHYITVINLTRNFGQISALLAGYKHAEGDCIVSMSADLQEPPELIWDMFKAWERGEKLVVANREERNDGMIADSISNFCWRLFRRYAVANIPKGGFDFFLMDRELCNYYIHDPEQHLFLQGRLLFYGFKPFCIPYERRKRPFGKSQTSLSKKLKYFIDGFVAHSFLPLRVVTLIGMMLFFVSLLASAIIAWSVMIHGSRAEGWASLMIVILFLSGVQMLSLGIIGEYLWRNIEETRKRPHYIIENVIKRSEQYYDR